MDKEKRKIYLDYAATSPLRPEVSDAMSPFYNEFFGNPSSVHSFGRKARVAIDEARQTVADVLGCSEQEIYFTSSGTESDNIALAGCIEAVKSKNNQKIPHVIISSIEHPAILNNCRDYEKWGCADITFLPVSKDGVVSLQDIKNAIKPNTILVSIMYVNNEIGTVQPIKEIGKYLAEVNGTRENKIYFHTDAVQAAEYFSLKVEKLGVDLLSLSGHKFGGPKGTGILYAKKSTPLASLTVGGAQEMGLRAGTENVAGIVGVAKALQLATEERYGNKPEETRNLQQIFETLIKESVPEANILGQKTERSPAISSIVFPSVEASVLLMKLDLEGVAVSSGSACSSGAMEVSHVIKELNLNDPYDGGAIRFSIGRETTEADVRDAVNRLIKILKK